MSKPPFNNQVDEEGRRTRPLQIALAALERGDPKPFVAYLRDGGTISKKQDRDALADALMTKPPFTYQVDEEGWTLWVAVARAANGDTAMLRRVIKQERKRIKSARNQNLDAIADAVQMDELLWRRANKRKRLPNGYHRLAILFFTVDLLPELGREIIVPALTLQEKLDRSRQTPTNEELKLLKELDQLIHDVDHVLETRRKGKSRKPRIPTA